ncbi:MAG: endonuclease III [Caldilineales bacterium]|nr:endonuclease III [Caldilineales bacterium]
MTDPAARTAAILATTHQRLAAAYGLPVRTPPADPIDDLVGAILSQNTSDINAGRAFAALRAAYPTWQAVLDAATPELIEVIRSGGLANQKAPRIQQALAAILAARGAFDLTWLAGLPATEARRWLTALPGIGAKSASIVLLFSLGLPVFPVDTHVRRVLTRVGAAPSVATPDAVMAVVEAALPADWFYPFHRNLIRHGREVCKAQQPRCTVCPLADFCAWRRQNQ